MEPLISVILPVYNIEQYIGRCMRSLLSQTYENLELLLIDDGSTDQSGKLCDQYAEEHPQIRVFHKTNGGLSDARNFGIRKAGGDYVTCIDPDDYVDSDYVAYLYSLIERYHTAMAICQHRVRYDNGSVKDFGKEGDEKLSSRSCIERMLYHDVIDTSAWAKLYKKELFDGIEYPYGRLFEDIATTYKLMLKSGQIAVGYESKYNYMFHDNSIVNGAFNVRKLDLIDMTDGMGEEVLHAYPDLADAVLRRRVYARFSTLDQMLNTDQYEKEKNEIIRFIKKHSWAVLRNRKAPRRDKLALVLLDVSYRLYRKIWLAYRKRIMSE